MHHRAGRNVFQSKAEGSQLKSIGKNLWVTWITYYLWYVYSEDGWAKVAGFNSILSSTSPIVNLFHCIFPLTLLVCPKLRESVPVCLLVEINIPRQSCYQGSLMTLIFLSSQSRFERSNFFLVIQLWYNMDIFSYFVQRERNPSKNIPFICS